MSRTDHTFVQERAKIICCFEQTLCWSGVASIICSQRFVVKHFAHPTNCDPSLILIINYVCANIDVVLLNLKALLLLLDIPSEICISDCAFHSLTEAMSTVSVTVDLI